MKDQKVPKRLIRRAAELWGRKLNYPVFDNGDNSEHGFLAMGLAHLNIEADKKKIQDMDQRINNFVDILTDKLIDIQERGEYMPYSLSTDYHPDQYLSEAAKESGIPESQFSCKSSVYLRHDYISTSFGYGAEQVNHYPLPDGSWLITTLYGSDISKIIDHVMNGNSIGFIIEQSTGE